MTLKQKQPTVGNIKTKQPTVDNLHTFTSFCGCLRPGRVEDWIDPHFSIFGLLLVVTDHTKSECERDRHT